MTDKGILIVQVVLTYRQHWREGLAGETDGNVTLFCGAQDNLCGQAGTGVGKGQRQIDSGCYSSAKTLFREYGGNAFLGSGHEPFGIARPAAFSDMEHLGTGCVIHL